MSDTDAKEQGFWLLSLNWENSDYKYGFTDNPKATIKTFTAVSLSL